jgi:hypothetical protein
MRIRETIVAAGFLAVFSGTLLAPREAAAQPVTPIAARSGTWATVSNVTMLVNVGIVTLMPRVYYNDPEATVGWKARWHISMLAPALSMTALTLLVDGPIRGAIKAPRPGCPAGATAEDLPGSGCETYGMPSTQSFAAFGATGAGTTIFIVDTLKYSNGKFNVGSFFGNVGVPLLLSVFTAAARSVAPDNTALSPVYPQESVPQIAVGAATGFLTGALLGLGYSFMQRPNCGYGGNLVCW